jgi:valyl-tRNA synthetase
MPELPKAYIASKHEQSTYRMWEEGGYMRGVIETSKEPFSIAMPPPNATGELHVGHASGEAVEDILARFERMRGKAVLLLPGTDHAAISSQTLVEKMIAEKEGKTRHDLGRDEFLKRVREFVENSKSNIRTATQRLGVSADWSRERYTMDPHMTRAVNETFVRLYNEGLIYRGKRIISWCPRCASSLSDLEVNHKEVPGSLWYIKYPIVRNGNWKLDDSIIVATTRPETMLGDTALAVHPDDPRYKKLIGMHVVLPIVEREIPIIADKHVDKNFGTGALKITPAHDMADYEISQRHNLQAINVIGENGRMTEQAHDFSGMEISEAQDAVVQRLQQLGFLDRVEEFTHNVSVCDRCTTKVEPLISDQWFVKIAPLAKKAVAAVESGKIKFVTKRFEKTFYQWMENIHDWNISRQIWWGHRIPAYTCKKCETTIVAETTPKKCTKCTGRIFEQDPDTLDTWFSSGLWTFATLGWPDKTPELKFWHPTSVMECGRDIIFFWVARMIMLTLHLQGEVPFRTVYMHGLVLDERGQKMSKTKGNGINLLEVGDKYGMDAVRMSLVTGLSAGLDQRLSEKKIESYRNFVNKLWNIGRFVITTTECKKTCNSLAQIKLNDLKFQDKWILHRLGEVTTDVTKAIEQYRFSDAAQSLYRFIWDDFADWYVEMAKIEPGPDTNDVLLLVLEDILKLAHPFVPFITEVLWGYMRQQGSKPLIVTDWPKTSANLAAPKIAKEFEAMRELVVGLRQVRADYRVAPAKKINVVLPSDARILSQRKLISALARVEIVDVSTLSGALTRTIGEFAVAVQLGEAINPKRELTRLTKDLEGAVRTLKNLQQRLKSPIFMSKAPKAVIEKERVREHELIQKVSDLKKMTSELEQLL